MDPCFWLLYSSGHPQKWYFPGLVEECTGIKKKKRKKGSLGADNDKKDTTTGKEKGKNGVKCMIVVPICGDNRFTVEEIGSVGAERSTGPLTNYHDRFVLSYNSEGQQGETRTYPDDSVS